MRFRVVQTIRQTRITEVEGDSMEEAMGSIDWDEVPLAAAHVEHDADQMTA